MAININKLEELYKTLDTSTNNGNNVLDPVLLSQIITEQIRVKPSLLREIPRVTNFPGKQYFYDVVTSQGDAAEVSDGGTISASDAKYIQSSVNLSYFYYTLQITNPAITASQSLVNVVQQRVAHAASALVRLQGRLIYTGSSVNSSYLGLNNALTPQFSSQVLSSGMMTTMDIFLRQEGYNSNLLWVTSPRMMAAIQNAAYSQFRNTEPPSDAVAQWGYPLENGYLKFQGIPVLGDPLAVQYGSTTNESLSGSGTTYTFANRYPIATAPPGGTDFNGNAIAAPVIKVSTVVQPASSYSISVSQDGIGTIVFNGSVSSPTRTYNYEQHHMYLLSMNEEDIVLPISRELQIEEIPSPLNQDLRQFRAKTYSALAVRNPLAHAWAKNIWAPAVGGTF